MAESSYPRRGVFALRFALNVFLGSAVVWATLRYFEIPNPIWAVAALIAATDPKVEVASQMFRSRIINVLVGCVIGLTFLLVGGSSEWKLPVALAVTILVSSYLVRIQTMWRQAPITAALVIASGLTHHSKIAGIEIGLRKVAEVLFGCIVGLVVSLANRAGLALGGARNERRRLLGQVTRERLFRWHRDDRPAGGALALGEPV